MKGEKCREYKEHEEKQDTASARELRNYLYQMQEQLEYILSNIDTENLSGDLQEKLK